MERRTLLKGVLIAMAASAAYGYDEKKIVNKQEMKIKDPEYPSKFELKHTPEIKIGEMDAKGFVLVEVTVGQEGIIHPSTPDHWIYEMELYADGKKVAAVELEPVISRGYLGARVKKEGLKKLRAVAKCNLHGIWESTRTL